MKEECLRLKRAGLTVFYVLVLCSLLLMVKVGTVRSSEPGYSFEEWKSIWVPTIDGTWTSADEWRDGLLMQIGFATTFQTTVTIFSYSTIYEEFLVEIYSDNTTDAGDYWQFCFDTANNSSPAPDTDDYRFDIVGHTTLVAYQGNGTGWTQLDSPPLVITWANSINRSLLTPFYNDPHWILEFRVAKTNDPIPINPPLGLRVAVYDASNAEQGVLAWPPTSQDDPSRWGLISGFAGEWGIPEGLTLGPVVLLSTAAVMVGSYFMRKRPKNRKA
jgi:hypothetical protein